MRAGIVEAFRFLVSGIFFFVKTIDFLVNAPISFADAPSSFVSQIEFIVKTLDFIVKTRTFVVKTSGFHADAGNLIVFPSETFVKSPTSFVNAFFCVKSGRILMTSSEIHIRISPSQFTTCLTCRSWRLGGEKDSTRILPSAFLNVAALDLITGSRLLFESGMGRE
jgi:hypothetical protein